VLVIASNLVLTKSRVNPSLSVQARPGLGGNEPGRRVSGAVPGRARGMFCGQKGSSAPASQPEMSAIATIVGAVVEISRWPAT
jgi:hypothetical protein